MKLSVICRKFVFDLTFFHVSHVMRLALFWILITVLLFGCISQQDLFEARFACIKLSAQSAADIPKCDTQSQCFEKTNSVFGKFDSGLLSFEARTALFEYQNQVAKSWLFFNQSQQNLSKIQSLCQSGSALHELPMQMNELNRNLLLAFESVDAANQSAVGVLALERDYLARQEADKVREEALFDAYAFLQNHLNDLELGESQSDTRFSEKLAFAQHRKEQVFSRFGFSKEFVSPTRLYDLLPENQKPFLDQAKEISVFLPFFLPTVWSASAYFSTRDKTIDSVRAISSFPAFEFFQLISELVGENNSVLSEWGQTMVEVTEKKKTFWGSKAALENKIKLQLSRVFAQSNELDATQLNAFDSERFGLLLRNLESKNRVSIQSFEINTLEDAKVRVLEQQRELTERYDALSRKGLLNQISLGSQVQQLKTLSSELDLLEQNVRFLKTELSDGVLDACIQKKEYIQQKLSSNDSTDESLRELKDRVLFRLRLFDTALAQSEKWMHCSEFIEVFESYETAQTDFAQFEADLKSKTAQCRSILDRMFSVENDLLLEVEPLYRQFKEMENRTSQLSAENCFVLETKVRSLFGAHSRVVALEAAFARARNFVLGTEQMNPSIRPEVPMASLKKKTGSLEGFFQNGHLRLEESVLGFDELETDVRSLEREARERFREGLSGFMPQKAVFVSDTNAYPIVNRVFETEIRVVLENPSSIRLDEPLGIEIPVEFENGQVVAKGPEIDSVILHNKNLSLFFSSVPTGQTRVTIRTKFQVKTVESDAVLMATQTKARIRRTIRLEVPARLEQVLVETDLESQAANAGEIAVLVNNQETAFWKENSRLRFYAPAFEETQIAVFFSVRNPVSIQTQIEETQSLLVKTIHVESHLPIAIPLLVLSEPTPAFSVKEVRAVDEKGDALEWRQNNREIGMEILNLNPNEIRVVRLQMELDSPADWAKDTLAVLTGRMKALIDQGHSELKPVLLEAMEQDPQTQTGREKILSIEKKAFDFEKKLKTIENQETEFQRIRQTVSREINRAVVQQKIFLGAKWTSAAKELEAIARDSSAFLKEADRLLEKGEVNMALAEVFKASSEIGKSGSVIWNAVGAEKKSLQKESLELEQAWSKSALGNTESIFLPQDWTALERAIDLQDLNSALGHINDMNEKLSQKKGNTNGQLKENESVWMKKISSVLTLIPNRIAEKIGQMRKIIGNGAEPALFELGILPPFSSQTLDQLDSKVQKTSSASLSRKMESALAWFEEGNSSKAFAEINGKESEIENRVIALEAIENEMDLDIAWFREKASLEIEKAKKLSEGSLGNEALQKQVSLLQKQFESGEFGAVLVSAQKIQKTKSGATGLLGLISAVPPIAIPLVFVVVAGVVIFVRKKREPPVEKPKIRIERIAASL